MSRKIKLAALLLVLILIIAAIGVYAFNQSQSTVRYTVIGFDHERAWLDAEYLTSLGPRLAGTDE